MNDATAIDQGEAPHDLDALSSWLVEAGLRGLPIDEIFDGFCRRVNLVGIAIKRAFLGINTLHPMIRAYAMSWDIKSGTGPSFSFNHADVDNPVWQLSPFAHMLREGIPQMRRDLSLPDDVLRSPVLLDQKAAGMTEWIGQVFS